jgi:hypothetical protein
MDRNRHERRKYPMKPLIFLVIRLLDESITKKDKLGLIEKLPSKSDTLIDIKYEVSYF